MLLVALTASAEESFVPLFVIERSVNGNTVHYDAKLKDGKLDPQQPVVAYWILGESGKRQELNVLERLKAYGFTIRPDKDPDAYRMTLVADKKKEIRVVRIGGGGACGGEDRGLRGLLAEDFHRFEEIVHD